MVKQPNNPSITASRTHFGFNKMMCWISALFLMFVVFPVQSADAQTRKLKLYFLHTGEKAEIAYKRNGKYMAGGLKKINYFLRDWRQNEPTKMDPKLLDLIWEVYQETGSKKHINVISAYRSLKTNNLLRKRGRGVAKKSQHSLGKALDFFIPGVSLSKLRSIGLKKGIGGVGYYPKSGSPFVHMDTGRVRHWPRMSRKQLVRVFPNGKTLHVPSDGKPLPGYNIAKSRYEKATSGKIVVAKAEEIEKKPGFFAKLLGRDDEEGEGTEAATAPKPVATTTAPSPATTSQGLAAGALPAQPQIPEPTQTQIAAISPRFVPIPVVAPRGDLVVATNVVVDTVDSAQSPEEALAEQQIASLVPIPVRAERTSSVIEAVAQIVETDAPAQPQQTQPLQVAALSPTEIQDLRSQVTTAIQTPVTPTNPTPASADQRLVPPSVTFASDRLRGTRPVRPSEGLTRSQDSLFGYAPSRLEPSNTSIASTQFTQNALTNQISKVEQPVEETVVALAPAATQTENTITAVPLSNPTRTILAQPEVQVSEPVVEETVVAVGIPLPTRKPSRLEPAVQTAALATPKPRTRTASEKPASSLERLVSAHLNKRAIGKWALATNARIADIADIKPPAYGRNVIRERPNTVLSSGFTQNKIRDFTKGFSGSSVEFLSFKRFQ